MDYSINPSLIYQLINNDAIFIDIRDKFKYDDLHIKRFINIPYAQFHKYIPRLPQNKAIYLICDLGHTTKELVIDLRRHHYEAYYIDGGFQAFIHQPPPKYY